MRPRSVRSGSLRVFALTVGFVAACCTSEGESTWTWTTTPQPPSPSAPALTQPTQTPKETAVQPHAPRLPSLHFLGVQFVSESDGFLIRCAESARGCEKELTVTHDGGRSWSRVHSVQHFFGLTFVSASDGFGMRGGSFYRTNDGGRSFARVGRLPGSVGTQPLGESTSMSFVDAEHGWIASTRWLYTSTTGGEMWTRLPFSCPKPFFGIGSVSFVEGDTGFLTCEGEDDKALYRSDNGGQTWALVSKAKLHSKTELPGIGTGAQIWFLDRSVGFIVGGEGGLTRTDDGGLSFLPVPEAGGVATSWLDPETGFAIGFPDRLARTDDGGVTWRRIGR